MYAISIPDTTQIGSGLFQPNKLNPNPRHPRARNDRNATTDVNLSRASCEAGFEIASPNVK